MSFALTTEQVRNRTKTVTRRLGWATAKAGDIVQPIVKGQGLKKGERVDWDFECKVIDAEAAQKASDAS